MFSWRSYLPLIRTIALTLLALAISGPFLTNRGLGTGEAMNYSLAVADGVTQMRAGGLPVMVGQSEFAYNGRIHPLRTGPGLIYGAGLLDAVTGRQLGFWTLQNLVLALSLAATVPLLYLALRRIVRASPGLALALTATFALSPGLLSVAYTADMFMTVTAAPFVVLVIGANVRSLLDPAAFKPWGLAVGLGGAWLAHPPTAGWLTLITAVLQPAVLVISPCRRSTLRSLALSGLITAALVAFLFVSARVASPSVSSPSVRHFWEPDRSTVAGILGVVQENFPAALLPVSDSAFSVGNFQLGYLLWALLGVSLFRLTAGRREMRAGHATGTAAAIALLVIAGFMLVLVLPVPWLTVHLWQWMPSPLGTITGIWPMQRLYLISSVLIVFGAGLIWSRRPLVGAAWRRGAALFLMAGLAWSTWQASKFVIARGYAFRKTAAESQRQHRADNIDLTITSYAFIGVPSTYYHGVMDPRFETRLLAGGRQKIPGNWEAAKAGAGTIIAHGVLKVERIIDARHLVLTPAIILQPGKHYLLTLEGNAPLETGLELQGPAYLRRYILSNIVGPQGFGLLPGNHPDLPLYTSGDRPLPLELRVDFAADQPAWAVDAEFLRFVLREVDLEKLPLRLRSLLPLRYDVDSPAEGCCLETVRRFLPGYAATVNGKPERVFRSPDGNAMVPVPAGRSVVELRYPGPTAVRITFWISVTAWVLCLLRLAGAAAGIGVNRRGNRAGDQPAAPQPSGRFWKAKWLPGVLLALGLGAIIAASWRHRATRPEAAGPLQIRLYLPGNLAGRPQPILTTGKHGAGTVIFVTPQDESHIRVGAEIWGRAFKSESLPVNYFLEHEFVISSSALYPEGHAAVRALSPPFRNQLSGTLRVELDGKAVLVVPQSAFSSTASEITVGQMLIGADTAETEFGGEIQSATRLPVPQQLTLWHGQKIRMQLRLPDASPGISEPLLSCGSPESAGLCYLVARSDRLFCLGFLAPDGTRAESPPLSFAPGGLQELEIELGYAPDRPASISASMRYQGRLVLGPVHLRPPAKPLVVITGFNLATQPGVVSHFTGSVLRAAVIPGAAPAPAEAKLGALRLTVSFPEGQKGRQEPLLVTGQAGAGDLVYVIYVDEQHIRLGFDHWGVGAALSDPFPINYDSTHELEISLGSLYPDEQDPRWQEVSAEIRRRCKSVMRVSLDDQPAFEAHFTAYPAAPGAIIPGRNRIGGSSCGPEFTGIIHSVQHVGLLGN